MIYIDRASVPIPEILVSNTKREAMEDLKRQVSDGVPLKFDRSIWGKTRPDLMSLFHNKCAYCESPLIQTAYGDVDHFRPKLRAVDLYGRVSEGYWWLAYDWNNLYLSCQMCHAKYKRNRFPVKGRRAEPFSELSREKYVLLDPCEERDFEEVHLIFNEDGTVASGTDRGKVTIDVFGLNRPGLIERRRESIARSILALDGFLQARELGIDREQDLLEALSLSEPYLAATRQTLQARLYNDRHLLERQCPRLHQILFKDTKVITERRRQRRIEKFAQVMAAEESYDIYSNTKMMREAYFGSVKRLERVDIENFKCINRLTIEFPEPDTYTSIEPFGPIDRYKQALTAAEPFRESWLALIGENATGKSAVLQAIALALMGDDERRDLGDVKPSDVLTHGQESGYVKAYLSGLSEPVVLEYSATNEAFFCNFPKPKVLILGYGATRLLRDIDDLETDETSLVRIRNLFNPFAKLNNVEKWLADTHRVSASQFNEIKVALVNLLLLEEEKTRIYRYGGRVYIDLDGNRYTLQELSDGFRTTIAMALDIMLVMTRKWENVEDAEGIVLIDEIGVHLHPRWKMRIVSKLREVFRNVQFIFTTHEPLCLRGLRAGETVLMKRGDGGAIYIVDDLPSPSDLRVDQLLTSEFFGLSSTVDPEVEELFNEYYILLAKDKLSSTENSRLQKLKDQLRDRKHLGDSPRDELMYEVIDKLLAKREVERPRISIEELKPEAVEKVRELWKKHLFKR